MMKPISIVGQDTTNFIKAHELAVLSTTSSSGEVHGAVVYYSLQGDYLYFITKRATQKAHNILSHPNVALTIFDEPKLQTAQIQGIAEVEEDYQIQEKVFDDIIKLRSYNGVYQLPPSAKMEEGTYVFFRVTPLSFTFSDYSKE